MLELGSWQEAATRAGRGPTVVEWVTRVKKFDEGHEFVRCRLVVRDFKPRHEGLVIMCAPRCVRSQHGRLCPHTSLEPARDKRNGGEDEVKCTFLFLKNRTSTPDATKKSGANFREHPVKYGTYARLRWFYCLREAQEGLHAQVGLRPAQERQDGAKDICQDRWNRGRAEEDTDGDA